MTIRVINLRSYELKEGETLVIVDRRTPLGNPYYMKDESMRDTVCDNYASRMVIQLGKADSPEFKEMTRILQQAKKGDIALGCWCAPKRCHADSIKLILEDMLAHIAKP